MPRKIELDKGNLTLQDKEIEGFLERIVTPIGTSAKADIPQRFMGRRVYIIVTKTTIKERPTD